jgi:hypothetical protein
MIWLFRCSLVKASAFCRKGTTNDTTKQKSHPELLRKWLIFCSPYCSKLQLDDFCSAELMRSFSEYSVLMNEGSLDLFVKNAT